MNMTSTNLHGWPFLLKAARTTGAKIVVNRPGPHPDRRQADWHIPIRRAPTARWPWLDHEIIAQGLTDRTTWRTTRRLRTNSRAGRELPAGAGLRDHGIPAADIRTLAREYATSQPSAIRQGVAIRAQPGGGDAIRAITCLPALVGAWRQVGGGTMEMPIWSSHLVRQICMPQVDPEGTRVVNELTSAWR